jgi:hypothetical protein
MFTKFLSIAGTTATSARHQAQTARVNHMAWAAGHQQNAALQTDAAFLRSRSTTINIIEKGT